MSKNLVGMLCLGASLHGWAFTPEQQANSFTNIYASTCLKHIANLDELREKLKPLTSLPNEKAAQFLNGKSGKAWPVPDPYGTFVLAVPDQTNFCTVYARQINPTLAQQSFRRLVATAPEPLKSHLVSSSAKYDTKNGNLRNLSYEWRLTSAKPKILFMLTTADAKTADVQALATASITQ